MTALTYAVSRLALVRGVREPVVITLIPCHGDGDTLIALRLARRRVSYVMPAADAYRLAAEWHGNKERAAKRAARKHGIPWRQARKKFLASLVPPLPRRKKKGIDKVSEPAK